MELGYMDYDEPTEKYGSVTKEAVEVFQRDESMKNLVVYFPHWKRNNAYLKQTSRKLV